MTDDVCLRSALEREAADPDTPPERLDQLAAERALRLVVAGNPAAPAHVLKRLRRAPNRAVRAAVAGNPNSPIEVLFELAGEFPLEVVENAALPLHMIAHPELPTRMAHELPLETLCALLRSEDLPLPLLRMLAVSPHDTVRTLAALHIERAGEPGPDTLARGKAAFRAALHQVRFGEPDVVCELPGMLAPWFVELLLDTPHAERVLLSPDCCGTSLVRLARSAAPHVLLLVAAHPNAPARLLSQLALHSTPEVRRAVASNPSTSSRTLSDLADTRYDPIRLAVAAHPATSPAALAELARDHNRHIRAAVARHPSTPMSILRQLASAAESEVRGAAQRRLPMSAERLDYLAEVLNPVRRRAVAGHPDTPPQTLARLAGDADTPVRVNVARHARTSSEVLAQLSRDPEPAVRAAVAEHPRLPPYLRARLEHDVDSDVRAHLARNPRAPYTTLKRLWVHAANDQRRVIAEHPAVTPDRRGQLYARLLAGELRQLCTPPTMVRLAALASNLLPAAAYEAGASSRYWLDRYVVASNPATPHAVVRSLARDGIIYVRASARATLAEGTGCSRCGRDGDSDYQY